MEGMSAQVASALQTARCSVVAPVDDNMADLSGARTADLNSTTFTADEEMHIIDSSLPKEKVVNCDTAANRARIELGLKQAFSAADTDHSGSISVHEVIFQTKLCHITYKY